MDLVNPGWFYNLGTKKMEFDQTHPTASLAPDARSLQILLDIANSLDMDIQLTGDCPSKNEGGRMPVLDLGMFVERGRAEFTFYQKSMSSPFVNMYRLAESTKAKRDSLLMEGIQRLRNIYWS